MEEILASIRRIISDDEARGVRQPARSRAVAADRAMSATSLPSRSPRRGRTMSLNCRSIPPDEREPPSITEAFAQAMEARTTDASRISPRGRASSLPHVARMPTSDQRSTPPLLSPRTDAAVNAAFAQLTDTLFAGKTRTIDGVVEDVLRPMLKTWLDNNLPPLVERMVREEIERVSRGRR